ncbi:MAG: cytochrome c oxidase accessory protein CcoG [Phycisphaerales bacterium]|nr:cytochrome c oxidase accessory protein CcoG [Phycisphaerales bacterium]
MSSESLLKPEGRVLSTLNEDGSRRWLKPRPSHDKFWSARRVVAYLLIVVFSAIPWIPINGKPAMFLDIVHREFTFFGKTFLPTDTLLLGLLMMIVFISIFLITALFGRVWCGWACPQTVYMEFLYRPIERLFEGTPGKKKPKKATGLRKVLMYVVYFVISAHLAQTFLSYFVGAHNVADWILGSPFDHPTAFLVVVVTTGAMMFDFSFFREQVCCVVCPYARMQSVLLDRDSLIVSYDPNRGEPRGKKKKSPKPMEGDVSLPVIETGDCIDCTMCVQTCPTGIDIRDGLQLECIGCAQCIDACNLVMDKIGRARGLIRYSSQRAIEDGKHKFWRPRVVIYPLILLVIVSAFVTVLARQESTNVFLMRDRGMPFNTLVSGEITNQVRVRITNRSPVDDTYTLSVVEPAGVSIAPESSTIAVVSGGEESLRVPITAPPELFAEGFVMVRVRVTNHDGSYTKELKPFKMLGPYYKEPKNDG